ncbi:MAG: DeoR/GlpR family DNA-binding transcription regulator [Actinobacteria bacterium]|nr:DeoR/GlpR family DNA-binding transcription regulator [Actinomycetota bacterium]
MIRAERQAKILKLIREKGFVENKELQELFKVTPITIRRDLKDLSEQNLVRLDHGGAADVNVVGSSIEPLYRTKMYLNVEKKHAIGTAASELINDGETIFLDSGTTTLQIAQSLRTKRLTNLTVVTYDIKIADELCTTENINVLVLGGTLRKHLYSLYGPYTEYVLENLRAKKAFLGVDGASKENGISNANVEEVPIKQLIIRNSDEVILVSDSTKFNKDTFCRVCLWDPIDYVITDDSIPKDYLEFFELKNIKYKIVNLTKV